MQHLQVSTKSQMMGGFCRFWDKLKLDTAQLDLHKSVLSQSKFLGRFSDRAWLQYLGSAKHFYRF